MKRKIKEKSEFISFISKMISDDPQSRPSIDEVEKFLLRHRVFDIHHDAEKLREKHLGINEEVFDLMEVSDLVSDAKRRADRFVHCPFSRVNLMDGTFQSYAELSLGTKMISKKVHDQVFTERMNEPLI